MIITKRKLKYLRENGIKNKSLINEQTNPIQINIPHPCSQNWDEMALSGQGRFCNHCQKTVIDFTTWSDASLYSFFSKKTERVCGRFLTTQVSRQITIPLQPYSRLYRMTIALGLTLIFAQTPLLLAQNKPPRTSQNASATKQTEPAGNGELRGQLTDQKGEPIADMMVQLSRGNFYMNHVFTDDSGRFSIRSLQAGNYTLLTDIYNAGKTYKITIKANKITTKKIALKYARKERLWGKTVVGEEISVIPFTDTFKPQKVQLPH